MCCKRVLEVAAVRVGAFFSPPSIRLFFFISWLYFFVGRLPVGIGKTGAPHLAWLFETTLHLVGFEERARQ